MRKPMGVTTLRPKSIFPGVAARIVGTQADGQPRMPFRVPLGYNAAQATLERIAEHPVKQVRELPALESHGGLEKARSAPSRNQ